MWPIKAQQIVINIVFPASFQILHLIVVSWWRKRRRRLCKVIVALFVPLQFRKKKKFIFLEKVLLIFRRLLVPVWMWMRAAIQLPASCQFVKRATDDWSSPKRSLIILKSSKMNWRDSSKIANFPERSAYWTLRATVEKPKLRAVGNPRNLYNSIRDETKNGCEGDYD